MKLQTQIPLVKLKENTISYESKLVLFGSCFSEHMGQRLHINKFKTTSNPFGILFHPKAIENLIEKALTDFKYSEKEVFQLNEQFQCFDAHSKLNSVSENELITRLNSELKNTKEALKTASHVIITLGTSWVYKHTETNKYVANCHKAPQKAFDKQLLSIEEISKALSNCIQGVEKINPEAQFIFTVSPVRHIKDGFTENSLSKAHLLAAIHNVVSSNKNCNYFSSFEIMMDELRDYRFYNEDMLHPNQTAINYIWEQFCNVWMTAETLQLKKEIQVILNGLQHKPFNANSKAHKKFLLNLKKKEAELNKVLPNIQF